MEVSLHLSTVLGTSHDNIPNSSIVKMSPDSLPPITLAGVRTNVVLPYVPQCQEIQVSAQRHQQIIWGYGHMSMHHPNVNTVTS